MRPGGVAYAAVLAGTLALTLVLTPLCLRYAVRHGVLDRPARGKAHTVPVPYLGGAAMVAAFSVVLLALAAVAGPRSSMPELALVVVLGIALGALGLVDDVRGVSPALRLAVEAAAALALLAGGVSIHLTGQGPVDAALTVGWVLAVTNAVNLLDNTDGLSAGVSCIASLFFFFIAAGNGQFLVAALSIALAGCAAGFLRSNFHPARIYMGDAGSLFVGFTLSVVAVKLRFDGPTQVTFFVPILVLGVALFDLALVVGGRLAHGRNPLVGGTDHTSHRLIAVGIPVRLAVAAHYVGGASLGWLGLITTHLDRGTSYLLMGWTVAVGVVLGLLLSVVPVYDPTRRLVLVLEPRRGAAGGDGAHP